MDVSGRARGAYRLATTGRADEPILFSKVAPIFKQHCHRCHAVKKPKGDLRIDTLDPDLIQGDDRDRWREVLDRLHFGDMPPENEPALPPADRDLLTSWIVQEQRRAARAANPATQFRRLTRREYQRTMQDLLGLPIEFGARLPEDSRSKEGFRNDGNALGMSPLQYEMYLQIADEALAEAIVDGSAPEVHRFRLVANQPAALLPKSESHAGETYDYAANDKRFTINADCAFGEQPVGTLLPAAPRPFHEAALKRPDFRYGFRLYHAYRQGETRLVVRAARGESEPDARHPQLAVGLGCTNMHGVELRNIGEPIVVDHAEFRNYEFRVRMEGYPAPNPGRLENRNSTVDLLLQLLSEREQDRRKSAVRFRVGLLPTAAAPATEPQLGIGSCGEFREYLVAFRVSAHAARHVRLSRSDPNVADEHIFQFDGIRPLNVEHMGAAGLERFELHVPFTVGICLSVMGLSGDGDNNFLTRFGRAPNRRGQADWPPHASAPQVAVAFHTCNTAAGSHRHEHPRRYMLVKSSPPVPPIRPSKAAVISARSSAV